MLQVLPYSDYCALSDIRLQLRVRGGWSPSYVVLIDGARSRNRETRIVSVRNASGRGECRFNTTLTLSGDRQRLRCDGGPANNCGMRNVPSRRSQSAAAAGLPDAVDRWFIKYVSMDLYGLDHWYCSGLEQHNGYTFTGSYYYAYVKMASCPAPTGRLLFTYYWNQKPNKPQIAIKQSIAARIRQKFNLSPQTHLVNTGTKFLTKRAQAVCVTFECKRHVLWLDV